MSPTKLQIAIQYYKGIILSEIANIVGNDLMMKTVEKKFNLAWEEFLQKCDPEFILKSGGLTKINYYTSPQHLTNSMNKSEVMYHLWNVLPEEGMTSWPDVIIWEENTMWILINK